MGVSAIMAAAEGKLPLKSDAELTDKVKPSENVAGFASIS